MTARYRLDLAYDGSGFHGWASQPGLRTVQGELELWIPRVLRLDHPVVLTVAGRTDAGVHARGQVAHVDLPADEDLSDTLRRRLARVLPDDLVVRGVARVPADFDARFSALWRRYVYRLSEGPVDPLLRAHVLAVRDRLQVPALDAAARSLTGLHDFAAFCKRREGATTVRTLLECRADLVPDGPLTGVVEVTVVADAFCHSMVRALVGSLLAVATGRRPVTWPGDLLDRAERCGEVTVLPPHGLVLEEVGYPSPDGYAARQVEARARRAREEDR